MANVRINSEKVFSFVLGTESVNIIPESGVSFTLSYESGAEFVPDELGVQTVPIRVCVHNTVVKITPTGGFLTITGAGSF